ncbi:MAG: hypothetical protein K2I17_04125 [Clostridia bacterium]|nr:hypothetical protein [Clostridia bacterium]
MAEKIKEAKTKLKEAKVKAHGKVAEKKKAVKNAVAKTKNNPNTVTSNRLELLITVVARNKSEYYTDLIQSFDVNMQTIALAQGTATAGMVRYLGLTDTDKCVIMSVIQENKLPDALSALEEKFKTVKGGNGIAFTVKLTSVIGTLIFGFLSNNKTVVKEGK